MIWTQKGILLLHLASYLESISLHIFAQMHACYVSVIKSFALFIYLLFLNWEHFKWRLFELLLVRMQLVQWARSLNFALSTEMMAATCYSLQLELNLVVFIGCWPLAVAIVVSSVTVFPLTVTTITAFCGLTASWIFPFHQYCRCFALSRGFVSVVFVYIYSLA